MDSCAHDVCVAGEALASCADPCAVLVCEADEFCCDDTWDSACIGAASTLCEALPTERVEWSIQEGGNGHEYQLIRGDGRCGSSVSWTDARSEAESSGGYAATITSLAENDFVTSLKGAADLRAWIGLSDMQQEGSFEWVTGELFDFSNWAAGEPDNSGGDEHFAEILASGEWNDASASTHFNRGYIVEFGAVKRHAIITFDDLGLSATQIVGLSPINIGHGYTLQRSSVDLGTEGSIIFAEPSGVQGNQAGGNTGYRYLTAHDPGQLLTHTMTRPDAASFDLLSLDYHGWNNNAAETLIVEATTVTGGAISQSFPISNTFTSPFETAVFTSEFRDLESVTFRSPTEMVGVFQIDDIEVATGPAQLIIVEPDDSTDGTDISNLVEGVILSSQGGNTGDGLVYAYAQSSPTGTLSFGWLDGMFFDGHWGRDTSPALRAVFSGFLALEVSIDYEMEGTLAIEAFDVEGRSLGSVMTGSGAGTLTFPAAPSAIASAEFTIDPQVGADFGTLDHMVIRVPEPARIDLFMVAYAALGLLSRRRRMRP